MLNKIKEEVGEEESGEALKERGLASKGRIVIKKKRKKSKKLVDERGVKVYKLRHDH